MVLNAYVSVVHLQIAVQHPLDLFTIIPYRDNDVPLPDSPLVRRRVQVNIANHLAGLGDGRSGDRIDWGSSRKYDCIPSKVGCKRS